MWSFVLREGCHSKPALVTFMDQSKCCYSRKFSAVIDILSLVLWNSKSLFCSRNETFSNGRVFSPFLFLPPLHLCRVLSWSGECQVSGYMCISVCQVGWLCRPILVYFWEYKWRKRLNPLSRKIKLTILRVKKNSILDWLSRFECPFEKVEVNLCNLGRTLRLRWVWV